MAKILDGEWKNVSLIQGVSYLCGHCGKDIGPSIGYECVTDRYTGATSGEIYICPNCNKPTYLLKDAFGGRIMEQVPGPMLGQDIEFLPENINSIYNEARNCIAVNAYTSAVLSCRKLLMNIAVSKGAEEGKKFIQYVSYLKDNHYLPPERDSWVDHIRKKGNEATHELPNSTKEDAEELLTFSEMLLRFVYEMPGRMAKHT
ncbi:DUF4145 domain-containing protein [Niallia sp. 01092]|uniref:DUF4145 domain-containing protein n=1 Tax=unclassified Niallia TaxID=2837522 RepID=UPI003FD489EB